MDRYAFLMTAMSLDEAKVILGFPPQSTPSPGEIKDAYRQKALKAHPDHGGKEEDMKLLNIAKDILEGKGRPTYDRRPSYDGPGSSYSTPEPPKKEERSFDEAKSKAGIPSGVDWLFVTPWQRGTSYSSDEFYRRDTTYVAYGRTEKQHVFVVANHLVYQQMVYGVRTPDQDVWTLKSFEYPIKAAEGTNPAWLYSNVVKALKEIGFKGKFNSKVIDAKAWKLGEKLPSGAETSIKHWLVNSGQVAGDDAAVSNRKHVVELKLEKAPLREQKPGFYPDQGATWAFYNGGYQGDYYRLTLLLNSRPYVLDEDDTQKLLAYRDGGKRGLDLIYGQYYYGGEKKQLTRLKGGKKLIGWMAENFKGLPDDALEVLKAAAAQMKG